VFGTRAVESVRVGVTVDADAEEAFRLFTLGLGAWWPAAYTWSGEVLESVFVEPRAGGFCVEQGPHGFRCHWGRVLVCEPPSRLVLAWQISPRREPEPDPDRASEVEVRLTEEEPGSSRVDLEHRGFERHGDDGAAYAEAMGGPQGWPWLLDLFREAAG